MKIELKILKERFYYKSFSGDIVSENPLKTTNNECEISLPSYATQGSAGIDLVTTEDVVLYPGETKAIHTGLAIHVGSQRAHLPKGWGLDYHMAGIIVPRSGLGSKGLILANTIGVIDEDYQGEIIIQAWNRNNITEEFNGGHWPHIDNIIKLQAGDRIAQLIFVPIIKAQFDIVETFTHTTKRGDEGFGSIGE